MHSRRLIMPAYNAGGLVADAIRSVLGRLTCTGSWSRGRRLGGRHGGGRRRSPREPASATWRRKAAGRRAQHWHPRLARPSSLRDADDLWVGEKLELQVRRSRDRGRRSSSNGFVFRDDDTSVEAYELSTVPGRTEGAEMFRLLYAFNRIQIQSVLVRRDLLEKVGLFDEDRRYQNCEDYDLWLSLAAAGALFYGMEEQLSSTGASRGPTTS